MRRGSHGDADAAVRECCRDAFVISRDPHLTRTGRERATCDVDYQWITAQQPQGFARQAGGGVAGGDGDYEI
jgi:hypothetical protein